MPRVSVLRLAAVAALSLGGLAAQGADTAVAQLLRGQPPGLRAAIWIADRDGKVLYERAADDAMPTASAIKVAYLVELFGAMAGELDRSPSRARQVLAADAHPALRPFTDAQRAEIRAGLADADARTVGATMIHGRGVSNAVYNAAANLVTAELGGPRGLATKIAARWPGTSEIAVRRYMLADRTPGDNEATARALGRVLLALARRDVPGLPAAGQDAARACLDHGRVAGRGQHFAKTGSLDSSPVTRVLSGWYEREGRALVYVVMLAQAAPAEGKALQELAGALRETLVRHFARAALWVGA